MFLFLIVLQRAWFLVFHGMEEIQYAFVPIEFLTIRDYSCDRPNLMYTAAHACSVSH